MLRNAREQGKRFPSFQHDLFKRKFAFVGGQGDASLKGYRISFFFFDKRLEAARSSESHGWPYFRTKAAETNSKTGIWVFFPSSQAGLHTFQRL